ncbi:uncharacterized protein LOC126376883 [Pectinophora gossypiella]|uniref:uncharacterized protein LOC126376883 n=1 Tax=Pectinophora gossypiella TaxID=13191 RepID=UPI00214F591A|nr:uncharacterized protein LOC126376883 [Pectinophora gossypiella]
MSEQDIDIDFLISLVQERPIIWDKSHEHYSDKFRKANEWVAVCKKIFQDYEEFEDQKKNKIGNEVVKKWRSVKDNFFRYVKKIKENSSSGSGAKQLKKYHYYNQLLFLMKVAQNKTDSSLEMVSEETERNENTASSSPFPTKEMSSLPPGPSRYVPASRKRSNQAIDDFEAQALKALQEKENRHLSFFKGILPSLDSFTELQTLTFQSKVINIITEIRFGEQTQSTTWQSRGYQTGQQYQATPLQSRGYQTGQQYQATPLQSRGYQTGQHAQSPSPSSYRTDEFEATYSTNTTINNFTDDSQEEDYNFVLLPNSNT